MDSWLADWITDREPCYFTVRMTATNTNTPRTRERPLCGARCRDGHACRARAVWLAGEKAPRNGRCRVHGGLSTGPKTAEGRARVAAGYAAWRERVKAEQGRSAAPGAA